MRRHAMRSVMLAALAAAVVPAAPLAAQQTQPPAPGPLRKFELPRVQQATLRNGMKVVVLERHTLPVVTAQIIVDAGATREPADRAGLAALTAALLDEGTRTMTGPQLAERMERLGAQFGTFSTYNNSSAAVTALTNVFPDAFALAAQAVTEPSFPAAEFERVRNETIANIEQKRARVEGIASDVFSRALFEPSAPYARPVEGTPATLRALGRDDVAAWHDRMYAPAATTILFVGDVTLADARQLADRAFGQWKVAAPKASEPASAPRPASGTRVILVDRPGSVQSAIYLGQTTITQSSPDYIPMVALNRVLGGGFNARVNMNLREKHGYTYGAFSGLIPRRGVGVLAVSSAVRTNATDSALVEALGEYRRIVAEPVPQPELAGAVNNVVASFPAQAQQVQSLRSLAAGLIALGLPLDYYVTYREKLSAVTPAELQRVARADLHPDAVTVVVVGDLAKIEQPIRARNLGTVEVWDAEGNRLR